MLADEPQVAVANESAGEQPAFAENLEAVANAEHEHAFRSLLDDAFHNRRKTRNRAAAQIIAVAKAAGQHDEIVARGAGIFVPDKLGLKALFPEHELAVLIAVGAWEADDGSFHG